MLPAYKYNSLCTSPYYLYRWYCVFTRVPVSCSSNKRDKEQSKGKHSTGLSHSLFGGENMEDEDDLFSGTPVSHTVTHTQSHIHTVHTHSHISQSTHTQSHITQYIQTVTYHTVHTHSHISHSTHTVTYHTVHTHSHISHSTHTVTYLKATFVCVYLI